MLSNLHALINHQPQVTDTESGPEPSLRMIVLDYYLMVFTMPEAKRLTERYMEKLNRWAERSLTMG